MSDHFTSQPRSRMLSATELAEASGMESTLKMRAAQGVVAPERRQSYHDTQWPWVNDLLAMLDRVSGGRAGVAQRLFTYLFFGGIAAIVNLTTFGVLTHIGPANMLWYYIVASAGAFEVSVFTNFIPNDYVTFRRLPGHSRSWLARCARFHATSLSGMVVTFIISYALFHLLGLAAIVAQAIALLLATAYNFTAHHLFTYAHKKA